MRLFAAISVLALMTVPASAAPSPVQRLASEGVFTKAQVQIEVERDRGDRGDRREFRERSERRDWREGRERREGWRSRGRCQVTIIRRSDGSVRRIRRCRY